jgi:hypothetical protein
LKYRQVIIPNTGSTAAGQCSLQISPQEGPAGAVVTISGSGFRDYTNLTVGTGIVSAEPSATRTLLTDVNGSFKVDLRIPGSAVPIQNWIVFAQQDSGSEQVAAPVLIFKCTLP